MGEGPSRQRVPRNSVKSMARRDIYENAFDEDVQDDSTANPCPECGGHVIINSVETVCEDCGLVLESQPIDHGPE